MERVLVNRSRQFRMWILIWAVRTKTCGRHRKILGLLLWILLLALRHTVGIFKGTIDHQKGLKTEGCRACRLILCEFCFVLLFACHGCLGCMYIYWPYKLLFCISNGRCKKLFGGRVFGTFDNWGLEVIYPEKLPIFSRRRIFKTTQFEYPIRI